VKTGRGGLAPAAKEATRAAEKAMDSYRYNAFVRRNEQKNRLK
jgi:hypothetical protein